MFKCSGLILMALVIVCCRGTNACAQDRKISFGLLIAGGIKYQFVPAADRNFHLFGDAGFGALARMTGNTEGSLSFQPKLLFIRENIGYHQSSSAKYYIESVNVIFNPEILFPTRHERWQITGGIGIDWIVDNSMAMDTRTTHLTSGNLTGAYEIINETRRPLIPFVSAGIQRKVSGGLHFQLSLRQDLRNAFPDNTVVTFTSGPDAMTVRLSHQPTRLGLGVFYLF